MTYKLNLQKQLVGTPVCHTPQAINKNFSSEVGRPFPIKAYVILPDKLTQNLPFFLISGHTTSHFLKKQTRILESKVILRKAKLLRAFSKLPPARTSMADIISSQLPKLADIKSLKQSHKVGNYHYCQVLPNSRISH